MTLAFEIGALKELEDPKSVFDDAHQWSTNVGVVSDQMAYQVVNYLRERGIYSEDFFSRADKAKSLEQIGRRTSTDRHVLVGRTIEDEHIAKESGWEYLTVGQAAEKAGWSVVDEVDSTKTESAQSTYDT